MVRYEEHDFLEKSGVYAVEFSDCIFVVCQEGFLICILMAFGAYCLTMLHTPLTTNLFLGLNQLDYTLNVFCLTMLHTPLTTNLFLGLNQLDYTLNVFLWPIQQNILSTRAVQDAIQNGNTNTFSKIEIVRKASKIVSYFMNWFYKKMLNYLSDITCYPVCASASGAIAELIENSYVPPDWLILLQVVLKRISTGDENESALLFKLLGTIVEGGQEK
ncbi:hypothetical protein ACJX0J_012043, partial [Zea mays]